MEQKCLLEAKKVRIFQGEHECVRDNLFLDEIAFDFEPLARDRLPKIEVTFDIDASRNMDVIVGNADSGQEIKRRIEVSGPFRRSATVASIDNIGALRAQAEELLVLVNSALNAHRHRISPISLDVIDLMRDGLQRAMQSRDGTELAGAIAALAAATNMDPPRDLRTGRGSRQAISITATTGGRLVFVSYARPDKPWLDRLRVHLAPLERRGKVEIWHDGRIEAGDQWQPEIERALAKASVAILLVSANFMASGFIYDHELPPILERNRDHGLIIFPVFVGHCLYERDPALSRLNAFNDPRCPLSAIAESDVEAELARLAGLLWTRLDLPL